MATDAVERKIAELVLQCNAKYGQGILRKANEYPPIEHISTGLPELNEIIKGGLPKGRIIEMFGIESSGKTSIASTIAAQITAQKQWVLFVDAEGTYDTDFAGKLGVDHTYVEMMNPEYGEQAIEFMVKFADAGVPLIIVDSIPALVPKALFEKKSYEKKAGVASTAQLLSELLPVLLHKCAISGTTVLCINQVRTEIGKMFGDPFQAPGGRALKHYASLRLRVSKSEAIEDEAKGKKLDLGQMCRVKVVKSKVSEPRKECVLPLIYTGKRQGFFSHEELPTLIDEIRESMGYMKKRRKAPIVTEDSEEYQDEEDIA